MYKVNSNASPVLATITGAGRLWLLGATIFLAGAPAPSSAGPAPDAPKLIYHQQYIEEINRKTKLDVDHLMAVFEFVIDSLPEKVTIYPSENYFYFKFIHNSQTYAGNIRLDTSDRDNQVVHFAYFPEDTLWWRSRKIKYKKLTPADGIKLEELAPLSYKLTYKGKSVIFNINDLSKQKPPSNIIARDEVFIGPTEDDAGLRFFLMFNKRLKMFLFILNETEGVPDVLHPVRISKRMSIGGRTGFVFYKDRRLDRKILIGVFEGNSMVNNYFDGPFDQLPDNSVHDDEMAKAVIAIDPSLKGKVDRFGADPNGDERFAVNPYIYYGIVDDLSIVENCVRKRRRTRKYYTCFNLGMLHGGQGPNEKELAAARPKIRDWDEDR
jgi:hypothetical protein